MKINPLILFLLLLISQHCIAADEKNILVLHSYHQGLEWSDSISAGILGVVNKYKSVNVHFEYLDAKRNYSPEYFQKLLEFYKVKAQTVNFDAIIACDNDAFDFLRNYDNLFYPNIPVVFGGVNDFQLADIQNKKMFFGFAEKADHLSTIKLVKKLFPQRKKILVIGDNSITGEKIRKEVQNAVSSFNDNIEFEYFYDFTLDELVSKVSHLDASTAIYLTVVNRDKNGQFVSYQQGLGLIRNNTQVPIFSSWDFYLGKGIVGGKIIRGFNQGTAMAKLALQIIKHGVKGNLPKGACVPDYYSFDYKQLRKFNIDLRALPSALIINKPLEHNVLDKRLLIIISVLSFVVIVLLVVSYFRRNYTKTLKRKVEIKTEELQKVNRELQRLNNEKNKFISIAAHDLRSPIGNIQNLSDLILEYQSDSLSAQHVRYLEIIKRSSSFLLHLVSNLLDYSIIESGKLRIERELVLYVDFVTQVVEENADIAHLKGITIELKKNNIGNPLVSFDANRIKQVFNNILGNAIKFSYLNSSIIVELSIDDEYITTSVHDSGNGIPERELGIIFKEFEKGSNRPTNKEKGTGLGLSIAKRIIEAHNGTIHATSELNVGSTFTFSLPNN